MTHTEIDHGEYPKRTRKMSMSELRYTIKDAGEALRANPAGHKAGFYEDEIHYCFMEIARRRLPIR